MDDAINVAVVGRLLLYIGALIAIGRSTSVFLNAEWGAHDAPALQWTARTGTLALWLAPLLLLHFQLTALELTLAESGPLLRDTGWGVNWSALAVSCAVLGIVLMAPVQRITVLLGAAGAMVVAATMGGMGHAAASEQFPVGARVLDAAHVLTMGAWIGGLFTTFQLGQQLSTQERQFAWRRFSRMATWMAPLTLATGLGSGVRMLYNAPIGDMIGNRYSQLLLVKSLLVVVVLLMGALQRRRIVRGDLPERDLIRNECAVAFVVLVVTAVFTGSEPPG